MSQYVTYREQNHEIVEDNGSDNKTIDTEAQSLLGVLNYICNFTRPDATCAVNFLATKASAPTLVDLRRAKRCLVYLRDTKD